METNKMETKHNTRYDNMKEHNTIDKEFEYELEESRNLSYSRLGKKITFYIPGSFSFYGKRGKYPVLSITGSKCALKCDHCYGKILESMYDASTPKKFVEVSRKIYENGNLGCLISGGCDNFGRLPWKKFIKSIKQVKAETKLHLTAHTGLVDYPTACALKEAGIEQALIDVIGSEETLKKVYHIDGDVSLIEESLISLSKAGLPIVPHVVVGLDYGKIMGEEKAIELISRFNPKTLVFVVFFPLHNTPMEDTKPVDEKDVVRLIVKSRKLMPEVQISLSCARPHGEYRKRLDELAVLAGVNKIAVPSKEAIKIASELGLEISYKPTCCSLDLID